MDLQAAYYCTELLKIKRGFTKNNKVSNAKIYLLLSIIDRIEQKSLSENRIYFDELTRHNYMEQCKQHLDVVTPIVKPYFHLSTSLFYHIKWKEGIKIHSYAKTPSCKFIKENAEYAYLDEDLWTLLKNNDFRQQIYQIIIRAYLSK